MQKGRVKSTTGLNLRLKPNGEKLSVFEHNEQFTIVDEVTFYRVKSDDGRVGYVHSDYVEKIPVASVLPESNRENYQPIFKPVVFNNDVFVGEIVRVDQDFVPDLKRIAAYAVKCNLKIWVTSSLRQLDNQVKGAIVKPASNSCHHIGHAIDMNILYEGKFFNSKALRVKNHINLPESISKFFEMIRMDEDLRWGGDFSTEDPVHIDNDFYHKQKLYYLSKLDNRVELLNA